MDEVQSHRLMDAARKVGIEVSDEVTVPPEKHAHEAWGVLIARGGVSAEESRRVPSRAMDGRPDPRHPARQRDLEG